MCSIFLINYLTKTFNFLDLNLKKELTSVATYILFGISALQRSFQVLPIRQTFNYLCSFSRPKLSCYHQRRGHQRRRGKNFNRQNTEAGGDESMNISCTPHIKSARTFQFLNVFVDYVLSGLFVCFIRGWQMDVTNAWGEKN